jgi:hypothetical protein
MHQESGAAHVVRVVGGIEMKTIKALLHSAPEHQQLSGGK